MNMHKQCIEEKNSSTSRERSLASWTATGAKSLFLLPVQVAMSF